MVLKKRRRAKLDILMQEEIVSKKEKEIERNLSESEEDDNESADSSESCSDKEMTDEDEDLHVDNMKSFSDEVVENNTEQDLQEIESREDKNESDEDFEPEIITFVGRYSYL